MKAEKLGKLILENSKCIMCGDDMLPLLTPMENHTFKAYKEFNARGIGFMCPSCGTSAFISAEDIEEGEENE